MNEKILWSLSYGLYAIGVEGESYPSACIANTVFQVTAEPVILAVSIHHDNYTHQQIMKHKRFTVSVLSEDTSGAVIGALGFTTGRNTEKLKNIRYKMLQEGLPVLNENICCWMLCKVIQTVETPYCLFRSDRGGKREKRRQADDLRILSQGDQGNGAEKCSDLSAAGAGRGEINGGMDLHYLRLCLQRSGYSL